MAIIRQNSISGISSITAQNNAVEFFNSSGNKLFTTGNNLTVADGKIGVGTDDPVTKLVVADSGSGHADMRFQNSTTGYATNNGFWVGINNNENALLYNYYNSNMLFATNDDVKMRIDSDGRLLLGTATEGQATADNFTIEDSGHCGITLRSGDDDVGTIFFSDGTSGDAEYEGYVQYDHSGNFMKFATNHAEKFRITSTGNIRLDHNQTGNQIAMSDGNLYFSDAWSDVDGANTVFTIASAGYANLRFRGNQGVDSEITLGIGNGSYYMAYDEINNIHRLTLATATGVISGDINDTSDEKLKENITTIADGQIDLIKQLRPVNFDWKNGTLKGQSGFIAQEIKAVIPDLVQGEEYDENDFGSVGYSVNTNGLVSHLTKALQEAIAKIETLESKVAALEGS